MNELELNAAAASPGALRRRTELLLTLGSSLALGGVGLLALRERWIVARELVLSRGSGWIALALLALSLVATPVARIAQRFGKSLAGMGTTRRALGMAAAWLALVHAATSLGTALHWDLGALAAWPHLRAGVLALATLMLLLATSYTRVVVWLRLALFKELHRLAYAAALLALAHVLLSPFAPRVLTLALYFGIFLLGLARFL